MCLKQVYIYIYLFIKYVLKINNFFHGRAIVRPHALLKLLSAMERRLFKAREKKIALGNEGCCFLATGLLLTVSERVHCNLLQSLSSFYSSVAPAACCRYVCTLVTSSSSSSCWWEFLFCKSCCTCFKVYSPLGCCLDFSHAFHEIHMCGATCFDCSGPSSIASLDQEGGLRSQDAFSSCH